MTSNISHSKHSEVTVGQGLPVRSVRKTWDRGTEVILVALQFSGLWLTG
jgi:hypothetical protein